MLHEVLYETACGLQSLEVTVADAPVNRQCECQMTQTRGINPLRPNSDLS